MIYKQFKGKKISTLGLGAMRLPVINGQRGSIDEPKARELIEYAWQNGVNWFDTAYRYHNGSSEPFLSSVLRQFPRDSWNIVSKMPGHVLQYADGKLSGIGYLSNETVDSIERIFEDQLKRCGVDYFDFYLLHNVCESSLGIYTNEELGAIEYLLAMKKNGHIKHLGFSAHGRPETINNFLEWSDRRFGNIFECAQIQLNYLDWSLQEAGEKYRIVTERGLPVISMEPCRGGQLASLGEKSDSILRAARPDDSIASWAFRFLQALPNMQVVLSGMTTMEQLRENIGIFSRNDPVTEKEKAILEEAVKPLLNLVPCTKCGYCEEYCPKNLDIPKLISIYNEINSRDFNSWAVLGFTLDAMKENEMPSECVKCGACAKACPQKIAIPEILEKSAGLIAEKRKAR